MNKYIEKEKNFISLIVQIRDKHKKYIQEFLYKIDDFFNNDFEDYEFIIINNDCNNNVSKKITEISGNLKTNVTIINLPWKHNIENAMKAGLDISMGDFVFEFDQPIIDFNIDMLYKIYKKCLEGYDVVSAAPQDNVNLSSEIFYKILNKFSHKNMELTTENFRIISRRALNRILIGNENFKYRKAAYHYSGFDTKVIFYKSKRNQNNNSIKEKFSLANNILTYHSSMGTKICAIISIIFFLLSLFGGIYTILSYIFVENIQSGWTTTMLFLSGSFTGLFFILTIISRYLEALIKEIQNKPSYVYKSIDKISKNQ